MSWLLFSSCRLDEFYRIIAAGLFLSSILEKFAYLLVTILDELLFTIDLRSFSTSSYYLCAVENFWAIAAFYQSILWLSCTLVLAPSIIYDYYAGLIDARFCLNDLEASIGTSGSTILFKCISLIILCCKREWILPVRWSYCYPYCWLATVLFTFGCMVSYYISLSCSFFTSMNINFINIEIYNLSEK